MNSKTFHSIIELEELAKKKLDKAVFDYFYGGAFKELTLQSNLDIYDQLQLKPRVLTGVTTPVLEPNLNHFGLNSPIVIAPTAYHRLLHQNGEIETAKAADNQNVCYCQSFMSTEDYRETAKFCDNLWMQVYVLNDIAKTIDLIADCADHGINNIVVSVDSAYLGIRCRDRKNKFSLPSNLELPILNRLLLDSNNINYKNEELFKKDISWQILSEINENTGANIFIKGILHPKDVELAQKHGFAGAILSNHGGRQLDTCIHPLQAIEEARVLVGNEFPLITDGGIRSGFDIFKSLCLGADSVMVGRPILWALSCGGQTAISDLIREFTDQLINAMRLCGVANLKELKTTDADYIEWGNRDA